MNISQNQNATTNFRCFKVLVTMLQLSKNGTLTTKCPKIMKSGKVVLLLSGRYAGRKAVIVKSYDDGTGDRQVSFLPLHFITGKY